LAPIVEEGKGKELPEVDDILIKDALRGDQKAFKELVHRHQMSVYHIIFRIVRDREATSDLVQETFMKAFSSLKSYRSEFKFSTWLYRIAANASIDHLRKKRIRALSLDNPVQTEDGEVSIDVADMTHHPEEEMVRRERAVTIEDAIDSLPDKYRRVIIARHKEEKSYEEIAAELGVPVGTVKARIFRARELLKKKLRGIR
jgi:RNA polymerase sigma factor (sigma-70 family)